MRAAVSPEEAHDHLQRNRFAYAAASQDANRFSRHHVEAYVVDHDLAAEGLVHVIEFDIGFAVVHRRDSVHARRDTFCKMALQQRRSPPAYSRSRKYPRENPAARISLSDRYRVGACGNIRSTLYSPARAPFQSQAAFLGDKRRRAAARGHQRCGTVTVSAAIRRLLHQPAQKFRCHQWHIHREDEIPVCSSHAQCGMNSTQRPATRPSRSSTTSPKPA